MLARLFCNDFCQPLRGLQRFIIRCATHERALLGRFPKATRTSASPLVCLVATSTALSGNGIAFCTGVSENEGSCQSVGVLLKLLWVRFELRITRVNTLYKQEFVSGACASILSSNRRSR